MIGLRAWTTVHVHDSETGEPCGPVVPAELHGDAGTLPADSLACCACGERDPSPGAVALEVVRLLARRLAAMSPRDRAFAVSLEVGRVERVARDRATAERRREAAALRPPERTKPAAQVVRVARRGRRGGLF